MLGTIQVDLDGIWTYQRYLGWDNSKNGVDPVYQQGLSQFLELFEKYRVKATFFIVGADTYVCEHRLLINRLINDGHEIANHTQNHPENFSRLSSDDLEKEIDECGQVLQKIIPQPPAGFRAPAFNADKRLIAILSRLNYSYDASILPSFINPLILKTAHSILRKRLVNLETGRLIYGFAPLAVYRPDPECIWRKGNSPVYEVPVPVIPYWRIPMHSTYTFMFGEKFFEYGLRQLKKENMPLCYLFHGIDLVDLSKGAISLPFLNNFGKKKQICENIIKKLAGSFELVTTRELVERQSLNS